MRSPVRERKASYVVDDKVSYFVTTIYWFNDITGGNWNESAIRDLNLPQAGNVPGSFTLIQHDIWPLEVGHATMVQMLKAGMTPDGIAAQRYNARSPLELIKRLGGWVAYG